MRKIIVEFEVPELIMQDLASMSRLTNDIPPFLTSSNGNLIYVVRVDDMQAELLLRDAIIKSNSQTIKHVRDFQPTLPLPANE